MERDTKELLVAFAIIATIASTLIAIVMHDQHVRNETWAKKAPCDSLKYTIDMDEMMIFKRYGYNENTKEYNDRCLQK